MVREGCFGKLWWWEDGGYGGGRCRVEREREVRRERKTLGEKWKIKALVLILTHA